MKRVVVTGAAGYIGGQTCVELKQHGYHVSGVDRRPIPDHLAKYLDLAIRCNVVDAAARCSMSDAVVHCAGTSLVGPSLQDPAEYYHNNSGRTATLLKQMSEFEWQGRFVFSSSCSVYGNVKQVPINESTSTNPVSPYGRSKLFCEDIITDSARAYKFSAVTLRYFNAVGADVRGRHGQEPGASHIFARIFESLRENSVFEIYGDQHATPDGTCIRDYIHVSDVARAHRLAIETVVSPGNNIYNLGTKSGYSVKEIIQAVSKQLNKSVATIIVPARAGDAAQLIADCSRFNGYFNFEPENSDLHTIINSLQKWYQL